MNKSEAAQLADQSGSAGSRAGQHDLTKEAAFHCILRETRLLRLLSATPLGLEPRMAGPKPAVLPITPRGRVFQMMREFSKCCLVAEEEVFRDGWVRSSLASGC